MLFVNRRTRNTGAELPFELGTRPGLVTKIRHRWVCERPLDLLLNSGTRSKVTIYKHPAEPMVNPHTGKYRFWYAMVLYLWPAPKENFFKFTFSQYQIHPLGRKFHADSKNGLKKSHKIMEMHKFRDLSFGRKD